jgi:5-methylcytosine-specific restriction endonuclease McrA
MIYSTKKSAREAGAMTYFTGNSCPQGHIAERRTINGNCVICMRNDIRERARKNFVKHRASASAWAKENPDRKRQILRNWIKNNPGAKQAHTAKRHADKLKATPSWLTPEDYLDIEHIYTLASLTGLTVDHQIPLRNKSVCGLHVVWNLQLLTREANSAKSNRFEADQN